MASFSHPLNRVDIERGLVLAPQYVADLPQPRAGQEMNISVTDGQNVWEFTCSRTYSGTGSFQFTGGWLAFASAAKLKPGNKVTFYKNEDQNIKAQYRIEVRP